MTSKYADVMQADILISKDFTNYRMQKSHLNQQYIRHNYPQLFSTCLGETGCHTSRTQWADVKKRIERIFQAVEVRKQLAAQIIFQGPKKVIIRGR